MDRRKFIAGGLAAGVAGLGAGKLIQKKSPLKPISVECGPYGSITGQTVRHAQGAQNFATEVPNHGRIQLQIAPVVVPLAGNYQSSSVGYNGTAPGPLLRIRENSPITVDVTNATDMREMLHWHGLILPPEVDGAEEQGTPFIAPQSTRRYALVPQPAGFRWYHTQVAAGMDLYRGLYTGQFGLLYVEPRNKPGFYDQEIFLALRDWEPFYVRRENSRSFTRNALTVRYSRYSINGTSFGYGEPIAVKARQRVLFHILNASATEEHSIALSGHYFIVVALDGNPVPRQETVETLRLGPGERIDAVVDMNQPGLWILGSTEDQVRNKGLGLVLEYANQSGFPQWISPEDLTWDYTRFGNKTRRPVPDEILHLSFKPAAGEPGTQDAWCVNGNTHLQEIALRAGGRYRLIMHNRSSASTPMHLHRHLFEIAAVNGRATAGVVKDTVVVPPLGSVAVDFTTQPGLSLLHSQKQNHADYGLKALISA
ncbi:MAG TPA: multicopper oxidase domain-containing protein [Verrucomicrobiae bacterium]|nr:multicopper oxidase domain-containing protein [Verrucomicrobiae bacterium]